MIREHSAGSIIYKIEDQKLKFLIVESVFHHTWGFPKGHVEPGETIQQTARREVGEEVGLRPEFDFDFSRAIEYVTEEQTIKRVDFFLSQFINSQNVVDQVEEIANSKWVNLDEAGQYLCDRRGLYNILVDATNYLRKLDQR